MHKYTQPKRIPVFNDASSSLTCNKKVAMHVCLLTVIEDHEKYNTMKSRNKKCTLIEQKEIKIKDSY